MPVRGYRPMPEVWQGSSVPLTDGPRQTQTLPAGRYRLTLAPSFANSYELKTITVPFIVEEGRQVKVTAQLVREPRAR